MADHADDVEPKAPAGRPLSRQRAALVIGLIVVLALAGLVGWLGFRTHESHSAQARRNLFVEVGRQAALNLATIDSAHAEDDVQGILNMATGPFYDNFSKQAQSYTDLVKQSGSTRVGAVTEAGLESEFGDEALVLVAGTVQTTNAAVGEQEPRAWRMRLTLQKVGDEAKVYNVVFVP